MFKSKINNQLEFEIDLKNNSTTINGSEETFDIAAIKDGSFHVLHHQKSYNAELVELNREEKKLTIKVNGNDYVVELKDQLDLLLQKLGMSDLATQKINDLKAPMPGKVLEILVAVGTAIKKGEPVLILEAMKMENILKATADATIKEIKVHKGDAVEKNAVLVVME
jgi:biotin carboxyl carrier protein